MNKFVIPAGILAALFVSGCEKEASTTLGQAAEQAAAPAREASNETMKETVKQAMQETEGKSTMARMQDAVESTVASGKASMSEMTLPAAGKAGELIEQAMQYVKDNKMDMAESVMEKLRAMKDSLPESVLAQMDKLEGLLGAKDAMQAVMPADTPKVSLPGAGM